MAVVVVEEIKDPQKWEEAASSHLFLKERGDLGGRFPREPWYFGALISRGIKEQLIAKDACSHRGGCSRSLRAEGVFPQGWVTVPPSEGHCCLKRCTDQRPEGSVSVHL